MTWVGKMTSTCNTQSLSPYFCWFSESRIGVKSSVFERLGQDSASGDGASGVVKITGLDKVNLRITDDSMAMVSEVFGRWRTLV